MSDSPATQTVTAAAADASASPSFMTRLTEFLGLKRSIVGLLSVVVLVGMGEHMAEQFLPLYMLGLGGGFLAVGLLNGMDNLLGALYSYPGGWLSDRLGTKRALLVFNLASMAGFLMVILFPSWKMVLVAAVLFMSWTAISLPATMSLVARVLPKNKRTMGVSAHSLVRRIPMALGPMIGGLFIYYWGVTKGVRLAFLGALTLAVLAAVLQQMLIEDDGQKAQDRPRSAGLGTLFRRMSPDLRHLLVSDILIRFCEQIPYAFVVIWAVGTSQHPGSVNTVQYGVLRTVEMATAILIYIPVAFFADRVGKKPFVLITFFFFTAFPVLLLFSRSFGMLILAFLLRGLKEFGEPSRKAMIMDLAPEDQKAAMFGLYYLIRDTIVALAAVGGAFLWMISPRVNMLTAAAFGLAGAIFFAFSGRDVVTKPAPA